MTRTFIAIELSDEARAALRAEIARLARALPGVRFVDPASLHLTLAFLGELDNDLLAEAIAATEEAAAEAHPFTLRIDGLGTFGPPYAPRVVWVGVAGKTQALLAVQSRLARALAARSFPPEERPFAAHLTLERLKERLSTEALARLTALVQASSAASRKRGATMHVEALAVMKSELLRSGARYTRLRECRFGGDDKGTDAPERAPSGGPPRRERKGPQRE
jgi:2'-5' RNA ligase